MVPMKPGNAGKGGTLTTRMLPGLKQLFGPMINLSQQSQDIFRGFQNYRQ